MAMERMVIDLTSPAQSPEPEEPVRRSFLSQAFERTQRPAFVSPRATLNKQKPQTTVQDAYYTPINCSSSESGDDVEIVPAFRARQRKDDAANYALNSSLHSTSLTGSGVPASGLDRQKAPESYQHRRARNTSSSSSEGGLQSTLPSSFLLRQNTTHHNAKAGVLGKTQQLEKEHLEAKQPVVIQHFSPAGELEGQGRDINHATALIPQAEPDFEKLPSLATDKASQLHRKESDSSRDSLGLPAKLPARTTFMQGLKRRWNGELVPRDSLSSSRTCRPLSTSSQWPTEPRITPRTHSNHTDNNDNSQDSHFRLYSRAATDRPIPSIEKSSMRIRNSEVSTASPDLTQHAETILIATSTGQQTPANQNPIVPTQQSRPGQGFTKEEDDLIVHLKEVEKIPWSQFPKYFPGRKWHNMQTRYSTTLSPKARDKARKAAAGLVDTTTPVQRGRPRKTLMDGDVSAASESGQDMVVERPGRKLIRRSERVPVDYYRNYDADSAHSEEKLSQTSDFDSEMRTLHKQLRQPVSTFSCDRLLRDRALGLAGPRSTSKQHHIALKDYAYSTMGPYMLMDDASGDVCTAAWSPDGNFFAAGAVAVTDSESMQYNKPRNLVISSLNTEEVVELPEHQLARPNVGSGANASASMRRSQDPYLYTTVQMVDFSSDGQKMYSVSLDSHLNIYEIHENVAQTRFIGSIDHPAPVDLLSVSMTGVVATGCRLSDTGSISVMSRTSITPYSATKVNPIMKKYPYALKFGKAYQHSHFLLAGFSCEAERVYEEDDLREKDGEICLWDTLTGQPIELPTMNRNVFDVAWNPNPSSSSTSFAVATGPVGKVNAGIHSTIRLYAPNQSQVRCQGELECPAWDINDVVYSPHDNNIIAVGSTEGKIYIWDLRQVKKDQSPLYTLEHGDARSVLPHEKRRWEADTGVRFLSWGEERTRVYTGSSDGVVKCWDPYRSEAHVRDVATFDSAIMSGAFSPDYCSLLIGEDHSRLNLLTIGNDENTIRDMRRFRVHKARNETPSSTSEASLTTELLQSGEITYKPMGALPIRQAVQGPNYRGPYRNDEEAEILRDEAAKFQEKAYRAYKRRSKFLKKQDAVVEACKLDCAFKTAGDVEANDRSDDRIPEVLAKRVEPGLQAQMRGLNTRCRYCGGAARPDDQDAGKEVLCERCGFACFRCQGVARISGRGRVVECESCGLAWKVGVLGYELMREEEKLVDEMGKLVVGSADTAEKMKDEDEAVGDAEREHYLSLCS